jgi:hypothetical protein
MTLFGLKVQQQALDFILPGKSAFHTEAPFVERVSNEALAPPFGLLAVPWILFAVRPQASIEDAFALGLAVKAGSQIEHGTWQRETSGTGASFKVLQPWGHQHEVHLVNRGPRQGRQNGAAVVYQRAHLLAFLLVVAAVATGRAPFLATVFAPAPWSRERSNFWAASRCVTAARK